MLLHKEKLLMSDVSETSAGQAVPLHCLTSVYGARDGDMLLLDRKAYDGIAFRVAHWPGPVVWMLSFRDAPPSYSGRYDPAEMGAKVVEVRQDRADVAALLPPNAIVMASGDSFQDLDLAHALPGRVIYTIEYTLRTRLDILRVEKISPLRKLRRFLWELATERRRKRAFRAAAGVQSNGLAAYGKYKALNANTIYYLDTRITQDMLVSEPVLAAKKAAIRAGGPLRLAFSGRMERMKGAHHLLPLARRLNAAGLDFVLEIFGDGSELPALRAAAEGELAGKLLVNGSVPFAEELVPAMKERVQLFICPHPQGDPSCTYMETLSCGVPILGFANEAWAPMAVGQGFGEAVPVGDIDGLAQAIIALDADRERLCAMVEASARFGSAQPFELAFQKRLDHLIPLAERLGA
jgi:colanic acid/amylovoran biosynthesis glycosyltransferase